MPLYVREGAIIPYGPAIQYTDEKPASEIILYVYTGQNGAFTLYEDDGTNYDYEQGKYAQIPFTYNEATRSLVIGDRTGEFDGMLKERTFRIVTVDKTKAQPFDLNATGQTVKYAGKSLIVKLS
ncbi:alpha-xylosidase [Bacteroides reticulotermitis JCM 10512]|uniref:Alpha-xylosidase n=2 Tax=Bacteroides reticulotermitis TaxID=1133319 RepID=W4UVQ3_9BACE|nr:alpha-xylosidase [Bacteroides reticulotermitis JCM 10512]